MQETKKRIKATFTKHSTRCKTLKNKREKAECMAEAKKEMEDDLKGDAEDKRNKSKVVRFRVESASIFGRPLKDSIQHLQARADSESDE